MPTRELPSDAPGHYQESHPNPYYIPDKLPLPEPIDIDDELTNLLSDAAFQLGRIDGLTSSRA